MGEVIFIKLLAQVVFCESMTVTTTLSSSIFGKIDSFLLSFLVAIVFPLPSDILTTYSPSGRDSGNDMVKLLLSGCGWDDNKNTASKSNARIIIRIFLFSTKPSNSIE